jgi:hypothetical protein
VPHVDVTVIRGRGAPRVEPGAAAHTHLGGRVTRLCPRCGSTGHGRPHLRGAHVSLSYGGGLVVVARADVPVGVDVQPGRPGWSRAEAVLKCLGTGLHGTPDETGLHLQEIPDGWVATRGEASLSWAERAAPPR